MIINICEPDGHKYFFSGEVEFLKYFFNFGSNNIIEFFETSKVKTFVKNTCVGAHGSTIFKVHKKLKSADTAKKAGILKTRKKRVSLQKVFFFGGFPWRS